MDAQLTALIETACYLLATGQCGITTPALLKGCPCGGRISLSRQPSIRQTHHKNMAIMWEVGIAKRYGSSLRTSSWFLAFQRLVTVSR
jgi:hypothetical protein